MHSLGIAHLDYTERNFILASENRAALTVIDFGRAKRFPGRLASASFSPPSSENYEIPEREDGQYNPFAIDVYTLGELLVNPVFLDQFPLRGLHALASRMSQEDQDARPTALESLLLFQTLFFTSMLDPQYLSIQLNPLPLPPEGQEQLELPNPLSEETELADKLRNVRNASISEEEGLAETDGLDQEHISSDDSADSDGSDQSADFTVDRAWPFPKKPWNPLASLNLATQSAVAHEAA